MVSKLTSCEQFGVSTEWFQLSKMLTAGATDFRSSICTNDGNWQPLLEHLVVTTVNRLTFRYTLSTETTLLVNNWKQFYWKQFYWF